MGQQQFKDEVLSQQVSQNDVEGIRSLRHEGAGLEVFHLSTPSSHIYTCKEGRTPLN